VLERTANAIEEARGGKKSKGFKFPNAKSFPWQSLAHPLLQQMATTSPQESQFMAVFHSSLMDLMQDHTIHGRTLFPGAGFVEMALAAQLQHVSKQAGAGGLGVELRDVVFLEPLDLMEGVKLTCNVVSGEGMEFHKTEDSAVVCTVGQASSLSSMTAAGPSNLAMLRQTCVTAVPGVKERYADLEHMGLHRRQFQTLAEVWRSESKEQLLARLQVPTSSQLYHVHPALLDGIIQLVGFVGSTERDTGMKAFVPATIGQVQLLESLSGRQQRFDDTQGVWAGGQVVDLTARGRVMHFDLFDTATEAVALSLRDFRFAELKPPPPSSALYEVRWTEAQLRHDSVTETPKMLMVLSLPECRSPALSIVT
ncbi:MAG: polyketide synthase dehydratase domain-containing protein, partial [Actinomycetota bacterium]|nr:polyketide synthase dehydratase domain-containing protein [Actinomycetota bacterium]